MTQSSVLSAMDCKGDLLNNQPSTQDQLPCHMDHESEDTDSIVSCNHCKLFGCNALNILPGTGYYIEYCVADSQTDINIDPYPDKPSSKIYHPPKS